MLLGKEEFVEDMVPSKRFAAMKDEEWPVKYWDWLFIRLKP